MQKVNIKIIIKGAKTQNEEKLFAVVMLLVFTLSNVCNVNELKTRESIATNKVNVISAASGLESGYATENICKISEDELILQINSDTTEREFRKSIDGIVEGYEVLSGSFSIDENLPQIKKDRLKSYLKDQKYNTIISVNLEDGVSVTDAKEKLDEKSTIACVDYNYNTVDAVASYGVNDTYSNNQYYLSEIDAQTAWSTFDRLEYNDNWTSVEIWVAVIDTGLFVKNTDLSGRYLKSYSVDVSTSNSGNYKKLSKVTTPDPLGHGTQVAGVIGAKGNNSFQTVGVASGWRNDMCRIMAIKASTDKTGYFTDKNLIKAIQHAIKSGAEVINMSLAGTSYNSNVQAAINNANKAGIVVVAAKGNEATNTVNKPFYPADYDNVISVSATDENNNLASYSNYGNVDICAPGNAICTTSRSTKNIADYVSGTSFAAPIVSATVALMKSMDYDLTANKIEKFYLIQQQIQVFPVSLETVW